MSEYFLREKRVRYRGIAKNQFALFMQAICFNLRRLAVLNLPNLCLARDRCV